MKHTEGSNTEKLLTVLSLGLTEAIKASVVSIDEAEQLLYSPQVMKLLNDLGFGKELVDLVHLGTELEDLESLLPDRLEDNLSQMTDSAVDALRNMPRIDPVQPRWYVELLKPKP